MVGMSLEVEQKFRVSDLAAVERQLVELGAQQQPIVEQVDCYFAHPARDFAQTDEALRIRRVGAFNYITYKGPKLDTTTKTRREIEIALASGDAAASQTSEMLTALGFCPVAEVRKQRREYSVDWQQHEIHAALDEVAEVGTFVELEIVCSTDQMQAAKARVTSLAEHLGLSQVERRSYLELLLGQR